MRKCEWHTTIAFKSAFDIMTMSRVPPSPLLGERGTGKSSGPELAQQKGTEVPRQTSTNTTLQTKISTNRHKAKQSSPSLTSAVGRLWTPLADPAGFHEEATDVVLKASACLAQAN
jgi:hypothetical protein